MNNMSTVAADLQSVFRSGVTRPLSWRRQQLQQLRLMLVEREADCFKALKTDLNKASQEAYTSEIATLLAEIDHSLKHLKSWAAPKRVSAPLSSMPAKCYTVAEPLGVVLVFGAWNYPIQLSLSPVVAALAAGNCAVVKPSELAPASSALMAEYLPQYLDANAVVVAEGDVTVATQLLEQRFDHIFYTGGANVGRIVMSAAAKFLTPVTLELGGKSPCIVDDSVNITLAARRIAWGKFMNVGQTCVAPDYILTTDAMVTPLVEALIDEVKAMYGEDAYLSDDYGRIVNERHCARLVSYLKGQTVAHGGDSNLEERYLSPTIVVNPDPDSTLMQEEIFGPILPIITVPDIEQAIDFVNQREKPLALYLFSKSKETQRLVEQQTSAGNVCENDTIMFMAVPSLPFGGVGESGMGSYHGEHGFLALSNVKSVMKRAHWGDSALRYAPFSEAKLSKLKKIL